MTDYKEKLDDLQRSARRKARELDEKLGVSNLVGDTARAAGEAAKRGAKTIADGAEQLRAEAGRIADNPKLRDNALRATRAGAAATAGVLKAKDWIKENPGKAAAVSFSLILGVRAGAAFPGIDAVLLGSHPHWLTHSALPVWGLKKAYEKFDEYLQKHEARIANGELDEAGRERIEFQRQITRYVGAPL